MQIPNARAVATAVAVRQVELGRLLAGAAPETLMGASFLPGWSRLTIACHLRFGAETSRAMTAAALAGHEAAFYPEGRATQRPGTLTPRTNETPSDVVNSLIDASSQLDALWSTLNPDDWALEAREPTDNPDLGSITLGMLALLRLTEVEVHGLDLDLEAAPWSDAFVNAALPMRVRWLESRRSNHSQVDRGLTGKWVLRATDGPSFQITANGNGVTVLETETAEGDAELSGSKSDLLTFLLGRRSASQLAIAGDHELAEAFHRAFPAP